MPLPDNLNRKPPGALSAIAKVEKLTQIAFTLPVAAAVGWFLGLLLDKAFHTHWIYIAGLIFGVVAGFVQLFRVISAPGWAAASAPDPTAPKGPGFADKDGDA